MEDKGIRRWKWTGRKRINCTRVEKLELKQDLRVEPIHEIHGKHTITFNLKKAMNLKMEFLLKHYS